MRVIDKPQPPKKKPAAQGAATVGAAVAPPPPKPKFPPHQQPVHPALQKVGFNGGIHEFNQHVEQVTNAHHHAFGYDPPPGLVLDIVRSPLEPEQYSTLFPGTARRNRINKALGDYRTQSPEDHYLQRPHDGMLQMHSPFIQGESSADKAPGLNQGQFIDMSKKFPMVSAGYLPVPGFHQLTQAVADVNRFAKEGGQPAYEVAGKSLRQVQKEYEQSQGDISVSDVIAKQRAPVSALHGTYTIKDSQDHLKSLAPEFFGDLPSDGNINQTWAQRIHSYQSSRRYWRDSVNQMAKEHFLSPPKFIDAWHNKQAAIKDNPLLAHMISAVPLTWFAKHANTHDLMRYWTGGAHGIEYVTSPLSAVVTGAKVAFNMSAGTVSTGMADSAAMNAYLQKLAPKMWGDKVSTQEAARAAAEELKGNPSLFRMVDPLQTDQHEHGMMAALDQAATLGLLIVAGHPRITGVRVAAGNVSKLNKNSWFNFATARAFNSVRKGEPLGIASKYLEGQGGEALVVHALENKDMTLSEFRQKAADLYHHADSPGLSPPDPSIFRSLRTKGHPTPSQASQGAMKLRDGVRKIADSFDQGARESGFVSRTHAVDFVRSLRALTSRVAPEGERPLFGAYNRTAEEVYNWGVKNLEDVKLANQLRDEFIIARAKQDWNGLAGLQDKVIELYNKKFPTAGGRAPGLHTAA
jgi:hypothetical protein